MNSGRKGTEGDTEGTWWPWDHQGLGRGPLIRSKYPKLVFTDLLQVAKPDYMPRILRCEFTTPKAIRAQPEFPLPQRSFGQKSHFCERKNVVLQASDGEERGPVGDKDKT